MAESNVDGTQFYGLDSGNIVLGAVITGRNGLKDFSDEYFEYCRASPGEPAGHQHAQGARRDQ
jgi:hypothetical protein